MPAKNVGSRPYLSHFFTYRNNLAKPNISRNFFPAIRNLKKIRLGGLWLVDHWWTEWSVKDGCGASYVCVSWWLDVCRWTVTRSNHCGRHDCSRKKKHSTRYVLVFCCCWLRSLIRTCSDFFLKCSPINRKWFLEHVSFFDSVSFCIFMVTLCNRPDHYIFILWFLLSSSSFFFFPRLISAAVYHTSTHGVALMRI